MPLRFAILLCMGLSLEGKAQDLEDAARGLQVNVENLEPFGVNGLPMTATRAVGPAIPELAQRLLEQWRSSSGSELIRVFQCCGWRFANRMHDGVSQVIQWRSGAEGGELLWSSVELTRPVRRAPEPLVPLLADCLWSSPIHGRAAGRQFLQLSGRCRVDAPAAAASMAGRLAAAGWKLQRRGPLVIHAERGDVQAQLIATPAPKGTNAPEPDESSLVLVESRPAEGARR